MDFSPFDEMQKAVDIVGASEHPTNKIAATIFGSDLTQDGFSISKTNYWPSLIKETIGSGVTIGNSSGTVHAETACILSAPYTQGTSLCITDPLCPNCAKNSAEAGIKNIYIDHKGFSKDFAERRGEEFKAMSMRVCEKAGINVFEIRRKDKLIVPIVEASQNYHPYEENPVEMESVPEADEDIFKEYITMRLGSLKGRKLAIAFARDVNRKPYALSALAHPAVGYSSDKDESAIDKPEGKYSFIQEPINRLLMCSRKKGLDIVNGLLFCTQVPTSREQVNLIGAGLDKLFISNIQNARDEWAFKAMEDLSKAGIIKFFSF